MQIQRAILATLAAFSALGICYNTVSPPETYGYISEQTLVFLFALAALWLSRETINGAVFLFFSGALLPVMAMVERFHADTGQQVIWIAAPFIGILAVAALTQDIKIIVAYTAIALVADFMIGVIYTDVGQAGALGILTLLTGATRAYRCYKKRVALTRLGIIERGLAGYVGGSK